MMIPLPSSCVSSYQDYERLDGRWGRKTKVVLSAILASCLLAAIYVSQTSDDVAARGTVANLGMRTASNPLVCNEPQITVNEVLKDVTMVCPGEGYMSIRNGEGLEIAVGQETKKFSKYDDLVDLKGSRIYNVGVVKMSIVMGRHGYNGRDWPVTLPFHFYAQQLTQSGRVDGATVLALKSSAAGPFLGPGDDPSMWECTYEHSGGQNPPPKYHDSPGIRQTYFCGGDVCLDSVCGDCCFHQACYGYEYCCNHCTDAQRAAIGMDEQCGADGWALFSASCDNKFEHFNQCKKTCAAEPILPTSAPWSKPTYPPTGAPSSKATTDTPSGAPSATPTAAPTGPAYVGCTKGYMTNPATGVCTRAEGATTTYAAAAALCAAEGAALGVVHSAADEEALRAAAGARGTWLGLDDLDGDGSFEWADGSPVDWVGWAGGPPTAPGERCAFLPGDDDDGAGGWAGADCGDLRPFTCERRCPLNYEPTSLGGCLRAVGAPATYHEAEEVCEADGATVASVHSDAMNALLRDQARAWSPAERVWLGYHDTSLEGRFQWADGEAPRYENWAGGEPNDWRAGEDCTQMVPGGYWNDIACDRKFRYMCYYGYQPLDAPLPTAAPVLPKNHTCQGVEGYAPAPRVEGLCLKLSEGKQTWAGAAAACAADGAALLSVHSATVNAAAREAEALFDWIEFPHSELWIGLGRHNGAGWQWADGGRKDYHNFAAEPAPSPRDCVVMKNDGKWTARHCSLWKKYICAFGEQATGEPLPTPHPTVTPTLSPTAQPPTLTPTITPEDCQEGYQPTHLGACAKLHPERVPYAAADAACRAEGARLASVHSREMDVFLRGLAGGSSTWLGLSDRRREGVFAWADGSPVGYTNWGHGEPNDWGPGEDCTEYPWGTSLYWNDIACGASKQFVCLYYGAPTFSWPPTEALTGVPTAAPTPAPTVPPTPKAWALGSCLGSDGALRCDGCSEEICWCDATCTALGDCCADNCQLCGFGCSGEEAAAAAAGAGGEECETAVAYGPNTFIDLGITNSRWGWYQKVDQLGVTYSTNVYAGAAQNDIENNGYLVGTLIFGLTEEAGQTCLSASVSQRNGWIFEESQLWFGAYAPDTVAFGQWPARHEGLGGVAEDTYRLCGDGTLAELGAAFVALHMVACPGS